MATREGALRVYLDCESEYCDFDFFRTEIAFADWVRDRMFADVHVLVSTLPTGSGGVQFTITFIGQRRFAGRADTLTFASVPNAPEDVVRRELSRRFKLGIAPYAASTPFAARLQVVFDAPTQARSATQTVKDRWNFWVYSASVNGFFNGESRSSFGNVYGSLDANRITAALKTELSVHGSYNTSSFTFSDGEEFSNIQRSYGSNALVVKSLGEHWAAGVSGGASQSDYFNQQLSARLAPAVEYNVFPYAEATRRRLTARYAVGASHFRYQELTIFDRLRETRPEHSLTIGLAARQQWGSTNLTLRGSSYLDEPAKHNVSLSGGVDLRVVKGLSLRLDGSASRVRDQIYLAKGDLEDEEVLVRRQALATSFRYFTSVGLSYSFGSIYNSVVNPRFGGS
jgi:hypothetical protein